MEVAYLPSENDFSIAKASRPDVRYICDSHYHDTYEIYYLVSGTRRQFVDHKIYDIKKGDMILIPKRVIHKTTAIDNHKHTRYLLSFSEAFARSIYAEMGINSLEQVFSSVKITIPESRRDYILRLFDKISEECIPGNADPFSSRMLRNCLSELLIFIARYHQKNPEDSAVSEISEERIQQAAKYICDHYSRNISLAEVADHVYMSETYFSKKFKKVTGLKFSEYLTSVRIRKADEMLLETEMPISHIAEACGFSDTNYFGDVFKKIKGVSPLRYRKFQGKP